MTRHAFTLVELLMVIAIMGIMGTAAVGGYQQMKRGMEDRGALNNVNVFVRAAYQRAKIDRQPTAVVFWNECLRSQDDDQNEIVVGRAVAVRRYGRITAVSGNKLADEFGDLNLVYGSGDVSDDEEEAASSASASSGQFSTKRLYKFNSVSDGLKYSTIRDQVEAIRRNELFLTHSPSSSDSNNQKGTPGNMTIWSFVKEDAGTADWKVGDAYGFEFAAIELPQGYIFGSSYSSKADSPVTEVKTLLFKPTGVSGDCQVDVYALRANGAALTAEKIGTSRNPSNKNQN